MFNLKPGPSLYEGVEKWNYFGQIIYPWGSLCLNKSKTKEASYEEVTIIYV